MRYPLLCLCALLIGCGAGVDNAPDPVPFLTEYFPEYNTDFQHTLVDLNGDQQQDLVVLANHSSWCGNAGCTAFVFENKGGEFFLISDTTITRAPIRMAKTTSEGWHDLIVDTKGSPDVILKMREKKYPFNPSLSPQATAQELADATVLIGE